MFIVCKVKKE